MKEHTVQQQRTFEAEVQTLALKNSLLIEKERIARDLHDNVGAHLAFVVTNLTHISAQAEKKPMADGHRWATQLRTIVTHTREAVKLLRETIWAIHQESFTVEEFAERLNQYINRYVHEANGNGLNVDVQVAGAPTQRLSSSQVLNLFRIVQEALNNVVKHAGATQAVVHLIVQPDGHINLRITTMAGVLSGPTGPGLINITGCGIWRSVHRSWVADSGSSQKTVLSSKWRFKALLSTHSGSGVLSR